MRFIAKWKDYQEDEASWSKKTSSRNLLNFVIVDNDLIGEGRSVMD